MKKIIRWIIIAIIAALVSHHPKQIFLATVVLFTIASLASLIKILISWLKGNVN